VHQRAWRCGNPLALRVLGWPGRGRSDRTRSALDGRLFRRRARWTCWYPKRCLCWASDRAADDTRWSALIERAQARRQRSSSGCAQRSAAPLRPRGAAPSAMGRGAGRFDADAADNLARDGSSSAGTRLTAAARDLAKLPLRAVTG